MELKQAFDICCEKVRLHMKKLSGALFEPRESTTGDYYENYPNTDFVSNRWIWLTSMITGLAPILYQTKGEESALDWANRFKEEYRDKVFAPYTQTMHDLGFLYLPYSVHLYQLTGDTEHRDTAIRAADELAKRFNIRGRFIEAWDEMNLENRECRMIIDSTMNLALLYWAWQETGHYFYRDVADCHLETVLKTLVREDDSVAHAWFLDPETGAPKAEANSCGYANGSHWARGTAWLVFGLAVAYSYTKNERYLETAVRVGEKYLVSLGESPVPVWDFRLPADQPAVMCLNPGEVQPWDASDPANTIYNVDSSAAAIMTCGFLVITKFRQHDGFSRYIEDALTCLSGEYLEPNPDVVAMIRRTDGRNTFSTYGDYYYMLAMAMYLYDIQNPWNAKGEEK